MDYMAAQMDSQIEGSICENEVLRRRIEVLEKKLLFCATVAGNPDPSEGCRLVIGIVKETLGD